MYSVKLGRGMEQLSMVLNSHCKVEGWGLLTGTWLNLYDFS